MNSKVFILLIALVIGPLFLIIPDFTPGKTYDFFLFADMELTAQTWLYFMFEHFVLILLAFLISIEETRYRIPVRCFFWLQVADLVDYLLTYNTTWVHISWIPVSMNTVSICIFAYVAWRYGRIDSD